MIRRVSRGGAGVPLALGLALCVAAAVAASATAQTITVNTTSINSEDWVQVTWSGVKSKGILDLDCFIGVVSPADANVTAREPLFYPAAPPWTHTALVKYQFCTADPSYHNTGSGSYEFNLINMRDDVAFVLFTNGMFKPVEVARTEAVSFRDTNVPKQVVTALTGDPTEMRVTWNSAFATGNVLEYGIVGDSKANSLEPTTQTYTADDMCGDPAKTQGWRDPGFFHTAVIKGLKPGVTRVWYRCGFNGTWTDKMEFTAAKGASADESLHIVAAADVGATEKDKCHYHWEEPDAASTYQHMRENGPSDVALHIGDIAYATGYAAKWDLFMTQASKLAQSVPLMTSIGNHEQDFPGMTPLHVRPDSGGECGVPMTTRFIMPTKNNVTQQHGWYSFDMGPVHFIMMNTELDCVPGTPQYDFFVQDMSSVDRKVTPWIIFSGHRPMYYVTNTGSHRDSRFGQFEALFMKYQVDLALWGHQHNLVRTCPVYNATCMPPRQDKGFSGTIHALIGNGGMTLSPLAPEPAPWVLYQEAVYGYNLIDVNSTHLHMQFLEDKTNHLLHEFSIDHPFPRP